jgi:hypothetical protein
VRKRGLRRRAIRRKPGSKPPEYITPVKKRKGAAYSSSKDYKYFYGHIVPEVFRQLVDKRVICWHSDHMLTLQVCAMNKFWKEMNYCKRCPLFQKDEHAQELRSLIEKWETDDLEEEKVDET